MTLRIVVVDDEEVDRYIVRRIVDKAGIDGEVIEFRDGDEFLQAFLDAEVRASRIGRSPPPILVLLDVNMPRVSGFEVLKAIEENLAENAIDPACMVVMMFSSSNYEEDRREAHAYSFVKDYIVKPLTVEKIQEVVELHYAS